MIYYLMIKIYRLILKKTSNENILYKIIIPKNINNFLA